MNENTVKEIWKRAVFEEQFVFKRTGSRLKPCSERKCEGEKRARKKDERNREGVRKK